MRKGIVASSHYEEPWGALETQGISTNNTTTTAFGGVQEVDFFTPVDLLISPILWDFHTNSGTFALRIDGVVINTRSGCTGVGIDMISGLAPFVLAAGEHTISVTRTAGTAGWRFRAMNSYADTWFHMGYWKSAGGGEVPGIRLVAQPALNLVNDPAYEPFMYGSVNRSAVTFTVRFHENVLLHAVTFGTGMLNEHELLIDNVVVGNGPTTTGRITAPSSASWGWEGSWIKCTTPVALTAEVTYTFKIRRVDLGSFNGMMHRDSTAVGFDSTLGYYNIGVWQEPNNVAPAPILHFALAA
jgi:hypothetical protein